MTHRYVSLNGRMIFGNTNSWWGQ